MIGLLMVLSVFGLLVVGFSALVLPWWGTVVSALFCLALPLVVLLLRYRPPEGFCGAVYRRGYFQRWVPSGRYTLLIPVLEKAPVELTLGPRLVRRRYQQVLSRDRVPMVVDVRVLFTVHPERIDARLRPHLLRLDEAGWREQVARPLGELLHNEIGLLNSAAELLSRHGRAAASQLLARRLQESLLPLGIIIDPSQGVAFAVVLPNATLLRALEQRSAAHSAPAVGSDRTPVAAPRPGRPQRSWPNVPGRM